MIPLFKVFMAGDVLDFLTPVLFSGYIGEGEKTKEFEEEIAMFIGNQNVVCTSSGTSALTIALRLAGVGYRDEVITTPMTCLATNMAILSLGAIPIWADILTDGTIDPKDVEMKITKRTKAIMCVDWGGLPCKLDELDFGFPVIEDACQSLGGTYRGVPVGNSADYVCFSFQAIKHISTADGGAIVIRDPEKVKEARLMKWFGLDRTTSTAMRCLQDPPMWGYKAQMNDILAAIGLANIRWLPEILLKTKSNADFYNFELRKAKNVLLPPLDPDRESSYWLYTILVTDADKFIEYMGKAGIECSKAHTRNDDKTIFQPYRLPLPGTDYFDSHHVCIPVGWWLSETDLSYIVEVIKRYGK